MPWKGSMAELPSGTVTFLFTDIERSTEHLAAMGNDAYADALDTHRHILREAFKAHDGHEMGTEGDSFFVAFARAHDAVDAAVEGQRALESQTLRVRMGMHTGEALIRGGEYVGHDVHAAKRISDAGHGGQILLSQTTADLVPEITSLVDLGPHRLKDLGDAQRIFQVGALEFPPLRSLESFRTNLPTRTSTFIGRENEIAVVRKLLDAHRLVTLTGIGGCGKTRLALQVGAEVLDQYPDGVFFVELGPVNDPGGVARVLAEAVRFPTGPAMTGATEPLDELVVSFLTQRRCLLIVDNCEHLIDAASDLIDRIQQKGSDVSVLATSREVLGVDGEQVYGVPSLPVPSEDEVESPAVSLFVSRAQAARPEFAIDRANAETVAEICRRLDGIPLAIEFAASRVAHLSPKQIEQKLDDRFKLLTGGRRRVQRQQTLEAALDWSFDLLSESERTLLRRLAVFPADFGLAAAEGICADDVLPEQQVTDILGSLVAKSLVQPFEDENETRYRLLETVRAYASERLAHAGEADRFRDAHRDWFLAWVESLDWADILTLIPLPILLREARNLRGAMEWCESQDRIDLLTRLLVRSYLTCALTWDDEQVSRWRAAVERIEATLDNDLRAVLLWLSSSRAQMDLDPARAFDLIQRAVDVARDASHPAVLIFALQFRAWLSGVGAAWLQEPNRTAQLEYARRDFAEALELSEAQFPHLAASTSGMWGQVETTLENFPAAIARFEQALAPYGGRPGPASEQSGIHLAACLYVLGERDRACGLVEQIVVAPDWDFVAIAFCATAATVLADREIARGADLLQTAYREVTRSPFPGCLEDWLIGAAGVLRAAGRTEDAARILSCIRANTLDRGVGAGRSPAGYITYRLLVREVREALGAEAAHRCREEGTHLSLDNAVALAQKALEGLDTE
jgi:predicted ATPase/class 3 adenylate cyclase